jgi:hypothetical protein
MQIFAPHYEILPETQKALWPALSPCKDLGFTLYGGTAIALYLGHRSSVDFDFFSHLPLDQNKEKEVLAALPFLERARLLQKELNTRSFITEYGVKLSFFGEISFGRVGSPRITDDGVMRVASLADLLGTKLSVLLQRVEAKDYRDIAALLRHGLTLEEGLGAAVALYGSSFSPAESVRAMTYFKGGNLVSLPQDDKETLVTAATNLLVNKVPHVPLAAKDLTDGETFAKPSIRMR